MAESQRGKSRCEGRHLHSSHRGFNNPQGTSSIDMPVIGFIVGLIERSDAAALHRGQTELVIPTSSAGTARGFVFEN
ncbi:MAG: hypothetical protein QFE16_05725 [Pseudomonadota bacterium]|nr:hypothetical protein [Pseudomonadota bacterium]